MLQRLARMLIALLLSLSVTLPARANLCLADVDGDGEVSGADISIMLLSFGPCGSPCPEDVDGDGFVTSADLAMTFVQWGACPRELIQGVIRDRVTNAPIAGATVFFYGSAYGSVTTDALGAYFIQNDDLVQFGGPISGTLFVGKPGFFEAPTTYLSDLAQQPSLPVEADATLLAAGPLVQGRVTDAGTGLGIAGASIVFNRDPMASWNGGATTVSVTTDANGDYAVDPSFFKESGLTSGFSIGMQVAAPGYIGLNWVSSFSSPITRNFALNAAGATVIKGTIVDRTSLAPVAGATVFFYGSGYGTTTTDALGQYAFTAGALSPSGGPIYGNLFIGKQGYFEAPIVPVADLSTQPALPVLLDASLLAALPVVVGRVTDAALGTGIAGAQLMVNRSPMSCWNGGATTISVVTDAIGNYAVDASFFNESGLVNGFFTSLQVNAPGYLGASASSNFTTTPWARNFALPPSSGPLMSGTVIDRATLAPIAGAKVFFYGSGFGTVTTDTAGAYAFTLSDLVLFGGPISGTLYIGKAGYFEALPVPTGNLADQPTLPFIADASLPPGGPIVTGTVLSASTSNPIPGATIQFSRNPASTFLGGATTISVVTDAFGHYTIDSSTFNEAGLTGGFFINLQVNAPGFLGAGWSGALGAWPIVLDFSLP
jgi:hypothetical protein